MKHAEEPAAKAESQRRRYLGFEHQRCIIQAQFLQRVAERLIVNVIDRIKTSENDGLFLFKTAARRFGRADRIGNGVPNRGSLDVFYPGYDITHIARYQLGYRGSLRCEHPHLFQLVVPPSRHHPHLHALFQYPINYPDQRYRTEVVVEPRINNQTFERLRRRT